VILRAPAKYRLCVDTRPD